MGFEKWEESVSLSYWGPQIYLQFLIVKCLTGHICYISVEIDVIIKTLAGNFIIGALASHRLC